MSAVIVNNACDLDTKNPKLSAINQFFQLSPELLCIAGIDDYFQSINPAWSKTLGFTNEELLHGTWITWVHPEDRQETKAALKRLVETKQDAIAFENRFLCRDGTYKCLLWTVTYAESEAAFYGVVRDIGDRKQVEEELRTLYRAVEQSSSLVLVTDQSGQVEYVNPRFTQLTGYTREETIGKPASNLGEQSPAEMQNLWETISAGREWRGEFYNRRKDGEYYWEMASISPVFNEKAEITHYVKVGEDITDRKRIEAELKTANETLEKRVQERTLQLTQAIEQLESAIAERQKTENALEKSQSKLNSILSSLKDLVWSLDLETHEIAFVNSAAESLYGCSQQEFIENPNFWLEAIHPKDRDLVTNYNQKLWQEGSGEIEYRIIRPDGELRWVHDRGWLIYDETGKPIRMDGLTSDITERKQAEKTQSRLITILEATPDFVGIADADGHILYINKAGRQMVGFGEFEDLTGKRIGDYRSESAKQFTLTHSMPAAIRDGVWYGETSLLHQDGREIPVSQVFMSHKSETGEVEFFSTIMRDMSDRKRTEEILRESESKFRRLAQKEALLNQLAQQIRNSLDVNTMLETAVQEIRNLLQIDRCLFAWYHCNSEETGWQIVTEAKHPDLPSFLGYYPNLANAIATKFCSVEMICIEDVASINDPSLHELYTTSGYRALLALPIQNGSGEIGVVSCGHHFSPRRWSDFEIELLQAVVAQLAIGLFQAQLYTQSLNSAQQAQEKAEQLEATLHQLQQTQTQLIQTEKMSSLGQLVAGLAHEINNPINFIYGNISHANDYLEQLFHLLTLYQHFYPDPAREIRQEIEVIDLDFLQQDLPKIFGSMKTGADRIRQIVLSLRNFSRLDEAEMKAVDIHEGIENTLLILQNRLQGKPDPGKIQLIKQYSNLPFVECYPGQLNQVFMNLLNNAIDALEDMSQAWQIDSSLNDIQALPIPTIKIRTEMSQKDAIAIRISDNGVGMIEAIKTHIFDPFFTTKPVGKGTGLGLSISYQIIVDKHGGSLKCESQPGQGSEFLIEIPIHQPSITPSLSVQ